MYSMMCTKFRVSRVGLNEMQKLVNMEKNVGRRHLRAAIVRNECELWTNNVDIFYLRTFDAS